MSSLHHTINRGLHAPHIRWRGPTSSWRGDLLLLLLFLLAASPLPVPIRRLSYSWSGDLGPTTTADTVRWHVCCSCRGATKTSKKHGRGEVGFPLRSIDERSLMFRLIGFGAPPEEATESADLVAALVLFRRWHVFYFVFYTLSGRVWWWVWEKLLRRERECVCGDGGFWFFPVF